MSFRPYLIALSLILPFTAPIPAQQIFGSVYGTVTDATGAGVPNGKVFISDDNKGTRFEVATNQDGNFTKDRLIPGVYTVEVEASGFRKAVTRRVQVSVDSSARIDVALEVGQVTESVEVTSAAPLLQSDRADVATTYSAKQLVDLPRLDRNFQSYLLLQPGTNRLGWNHASSENPQGSIQIMVNGQHFAGTGFQLDGTDNQDPILGIIVINPTIDSVVEAKIASQNYDAEFGYVGSGLVNTSTKSGSNAIHGSAFEYIRNNSPGFQSSARNPFNNAENNGTPPLVQNQFGGSIGGALVQNKLFWFGDAQLSRRRTGSSVQTSVPTALARTGNLSQYVFPNRNNFYDPLSGNQTTGAGRMQFPNNTIPADRFSPQARRLLEFLPLPNNVDANTTAELRPIVNNYVTTGSEQFDSNQWNTRWDWFANEKNQLFGRYSFAGFSKFAPGAYGVLPGGPALDRINFAGASDVRNQSLAIGYTRTFSPTLITDWRFGYMRYRVNVLPNGLGTRPAADAGIPGLNLDDFFTSGMPAFFIEGEGGTNFGYGLGVNQCNCPLAQREQQFQFVGNAGKTLGNHSLKFGADIRRALNIRVPSDTHRAGELRFSPQRTALVDANGGTQQGLGLATFLLGQVTGGGRYVSPTTDASESQPRLFWYGQDTWRVTDKLQLNYGMRWEMIFPERVNAAGNGGQLDLRTGEIVVAGVGGNSLSMIQEMKWTNFAPRLGVTYQLTPKTVIRAGYGWSYQLGTFGSTFGHNVTQNLPVLANQQFVRPTNFGSVFTLAQGPAAPAFPTPNQQGRFRLPPNIAGKARPENVRLPRVIQYNATVQRQLGRDFSFSVGYVGNVGRHVFAGDGPNFNVNEAAFIPGQPNADLRKPYFALYGWNQGIDLYCNCATNRYHSLQITGDKRFSGGFSYNVNYTYQDAVGDSGDSFTFLYNRPLGRGQRDNITHQQFVFAPTWELPFGRGRKFGGEWNRLLNGLVGGWNVSGISTLYSGRPFTPNIGDTPSGAVRPNAGPAGRPDSGTASPYENAKGDRTQFYVGGIGSGAPFALPANNTFGNFPINGLRGPGFFNQDASLMKYFSFTEKYRMSLRLETFNSLNHTNLGDPESNVTSPNAGRITGIAPSYEMRRLQFALRLDF
ncbi:MAG: TonB-dependent receptor domain-containing protein [Bryobacteraceae bacterium]